MDIIDSLNIIQTVGGKIPMYNNIGKKLKTLAFTGFAVSSIIAVIVGSTIIIKGNDLLRGLAIILCGVFFSWTGSFVLYGFGQLVENSDIIRSSLTIDNQKEFSNTEVIRNSRQETLTQWYRSGRITLEEYEKLMNSQKN